ncbi:hypothetical protein ACFVUB_11190 [Streptomyces niveus]|uniref:hypothetical protein n=1 Tax=Streptomyces niveus TaxID=193462 RepID=UPI0036DD4E4D
MTIVSPAAQTAPTQITPAPELSVGLADTVDLALAAFGADERTIRAGRLAVTRGQVTAIFTETVREQPEHGWLPMVDILADLTERVAEGKSLRTLVARIAEDKAREEEATEAGHYRWCTGQCITHQYAEQHGGGTYIEHVGKSVDLKISDGHDTIELTATLGADEALMTGGPSVYLTPPEGNGCFLDGPALDTVIADVEKFLDGLKTMRPQIETERKAVQS